MSDPVLYILLGRVAVVLAAVLILPVRLAGRRDTRVEVGDAEGAAKAGDEG